MTAKQFHKSVTGDQSDFLDRFLALVADRQMAFCVIGGLAVNAYVEPMVTLDCDVVVIASRLEELEKVLRTQFNVERHPHSLNVSDPGSQLRIQIQTDPRYQEFLPRRETREVLGRSLPVAALTDLLQGKLWAYQDGTRRRTKREKDRLDILRLVEHHPDLANRVPAGIV